jgi:ABC-type dipeptide/oligopeptide/nickel transport system permease component
MEAIFTYKSNWWGYILKRVWITFIIFILASILVFFPVRAVFADNPLGFYMSNANISREQFEKLKKDVTETYHLNEPLIIQYFYWMGGIFTGDWGASLIRTEEVDQHGQPIKHYEIRGPHNPGWIPDP